MRAEIVQTEHLAQKLKFGTDDGAERRRDSVRVRARRAHALLKPLVSEEMQAAYEATVGFTGDHDIF
jgi:hypothetical protein